VCFDESNILQKKTNLNSTPDILPIHLPMLVSSNPTCQNSLPILSPTPSSRIETPIIAWIEEPENSSQLKNRLDIETPHQNTNSSLERSDAKRPGLEPSFAQIRVHLQRNRQSSIRLWDSVTFSYNNTPSENIIDLVEFYLSIEIDCFWEVTQERANPINFQEENLHLG